MDDNQQFVETLRSQIRREYSQEATEPEKGFHFHTGRPLAAKLGYREEWLAGMPEASVASLAGTGNPFSLGVLQPGEHVVDVGCGAGLDSLIAARMVGPSGRVIGVDMTRAQLEKASRLASEHVEFRLGYIEELPVDAGFVDCVISNGVINLATDKHRVFAAAARALRPSGRLAIADIVTAVQLPEGVTCDAALWAACIGGGMQVDRYREAIEAAGFHVDTVRENTAYRFVSDRATDATTKYGVTSISLLAHRT